MDAQSELRRETLDYATPHSHPPAGWRVSRLRLAEVAVVFGIVAVLVALLLPALSRPKRPSLQGVCRSNMRMLLLGCLMYAAEHGRQFPERLDEIIVPYQLPPRVFICPVTKDLPATGNNAQAQAASFAQGGHCSYVYVGVGQTDRAPADTVILYEPRPRHGPSPQVMHVGFADGNVRTLKAAEAQQLLTLIAARNGPVRWPPPATQPTTQTAKTP